MGLERGGDPEGRMSEEEVQRVLGHGELPADPTVREFVVGTRMRRYRYRIEKSYVDWLNVV